MSDAENLLATTFDYHSGDNIDDRGFNILGEKLAETEKNEIWSLSKRENDCVKFYLIENTNDEFKEYYLSHRNKINKLVSKIKTFFKEYQNYLLITDFPNKPNLREFPIGVDSKKDTYYLKMERLTATLLERNVPVKNFIIDSFEILVKLHKMGYVYNNFSPHNLMYRDDELCLIDFKYLTEDGEELKNHGDNVFYSLNIIDTNKNEYPIVSPIDDYESLCYVAQFLLNGKNLQFSSDMAEINQKDDLSFLDKPLRKIIKGLRKINLDNKETDDIVSESIDIFMKYINDFEEGIEVPTNLY